jgi:hypothetical protein
MLSNQLFERLFGREIVLDAIQCRSTLSLCEFPACISVNDAFILRN